MSLIHYLINIIFPWDSNFITYEEEQHEDLYSKLRKGLTNAVEKD